MLDQNTDRMWYVIGAIIIGGLILTSSIVLFTDVAFAGVGDAFSELTSMSYDFRATDEKYFEVQTLADGSVEIIGYDEDGPKNIVIPRVIEGKYVTSIINISPSGGPGVFQDRGITSVEFPETIVKIGGKAFQGNRIKEVYLPDSVTTLRGNAFSYNEITELRLSESMTYIGSVAFVHNNLESVHVPKSTRNMRPGGFKHNGLKNVYLYRGTSLEDGVESVFLPGNDGVEIIYLD